MSQYSTNNNIKCNNTFFFRFLADDGNCFRHRLLTISNIYTYVRGSREGFPTYPMFIHFALTVFPAPLPVLFKVTGVSLSGCLILRRGSHNRAPNRMLNNVVGVDAVYAIAVICPVEPLQVVPEASMPRKHLRQSECQG